MCPISKLTIANEIFETSIKLNLETKRGAEIHPTLQKLREKLDLLENFVKGNFKEQAAEIPRTQR